MTRSHTDGGALDHVLTKVLDYALEHPVRYALTFYGVLNISDLMLLEKDDYNVAFSYPNPDDNNVLVTKTLNIKDQRTMGMVKSWYMNQPQGTFTSFKPWYDLTEASFNVWKASASITGTPNQPSTTPHTSNNPNPSPTHSSTPSFQQGVKINFSDYPKLKDDKQWRNFQRQLMACAAAHDTTDVLNPTFVPDENNLAEVTAFNQKKRFMYNVFTQCIQTSKGRICVRQNIHNVDGQQVYAKLIGVFADNLSAQLAASGLRSELITFKLDEK
jgi:hypothetical protein